LEEEDQHLSVIIPPKIDMDPITLSMIDKFYESHDIDSRNYHEFKALIAQVSGLTSEDVAKLETLYYQYYYDLFDALHAYFNNKNFVQFEERIRNIVNIDLDELSSGPASPGEKRRMVIYHSFHALLNNLKKQRRITEKQNKLYMYLYTEEDVSLLAAYEVYQFTKDENEFIDTLLLIEQFQYFENDTKFLNDISEFTETVQEQFKIIYAHKRYLDLATRTTLEKIIRAGDKTVLSLYK